VLTALHVVADRHSDPPTPYQGQISLTFPGGQTSASILSRLQDPKADWVILECANPPITEPVPLDSIESDDITWETFGFPDANPRDGMVQSGTIEAVHAELDGVPVHQLFSKQAAAGDGAPVKGFSGAPVLVDDHIVGVLRFALMRDDRAVAGTLYACPSASVAIRRSAAVKLVRRGRWRWLALLPLLAPLPVVAGLHFMPVNGAAVRLDAVADRVGMVMAVSAPLMASPLRVDTLRAFGLRESLLPVSGSGPRSLQEARLEVMSGKESGSNGTIGLDVVTIPAGTELVVEQIRGSNEYLVSFTGSIPDLPVSVDGPIRFRVPGVEDTSVRVSRETVTLRPDSAGADLYLSSPSAEFPTTIGPLEVRDLDLTRLERFREGTRSHDSPASTIRTGRFYFTALGGDGDSLTQGDHLAFRGSRGWLRITRQESPGGLALRFNGYIDGIREGPRPMPTRLAWLIGRHLPLAIGVILAYAVIVGVLVRRRWRKVL
jgi:hypothetical protein